MLNLILGIAWFLLPAYLSNMTPPVVAKLLKDRWDWSADFGLTLNGKRILGNHKTIRGFLSGTAVAALIGHFQAGWSLGPFLSRIALVDYTRVNGALLGALLGFGALLGDSVKSFFKRRASIRPGGRWIPFDQIDFIIGSLALASFLNPLSWQVWAIALIGHPVLVIAMKHLGYWLKINDEKW